VPLLDPSQTASMMRKAAIDYSEPFFGAVSVVTSHPHPTAPTGW
jgi:hypothetical protein